MSTVWLARARWRRRGAWLWPAFVLLTALDAFIGHQLPALGETQTVLAAGLSGCVLNLIGVVLLSRPLGAMLRRRRPDFPAVVARDYAGTTVVIAVSVGLLVAGLLHRPSVLGQRRAMQDAIARAQAWIGDRAPAEFRRNVAAVDAFAIEPGSIYRACVHSADGRRSFCVIVKTRLPFARSVTFSGYEPNSVFAQGMG